MYVICTNVPKRQMPAADAVRSYKALSDVEHAFRSLKTIDLKVRPIYHWLEDRVRAHIFLCVLAYYVEWHMREAWRELLFADEDIVAKAIAIRWHPHNDHKPRCRRSPNAPTTTARRCTASARSWRSYPPSAIDVAGGRTAVHTRRIIDATIDLLVEGGMDALTFQNIAERAGVSRATMYRRWVSPAHLAVDAIRATAGDNIEIVDSGSLRGDLAAILRQVGTFIGTPVGLAAITASVQIGPTGSPANARSWNDRWDQVRPVFDRAIARGELPDNVDAQTLFACLSGALYFRLQVMGQRIDEQWIERVLTETLDRRAD